MLRRLRSAGAGALWEIPAGTLAAGETPEACARRELLEEAGVSAEHMEPLTAIWTTPGFTDEVIHLFLATGLTAGAANPQRAEVIQVVPRPLPPGPRAVRRGQIPRAEPSVAVLYFARGA